MGIEIVLSLLIIFIKYRKTVQMVKQVYPTFIAEYKEDFLVYVPDMDIYTEGKIWQMPLRWQEMQSD